jgi:hypothetical protein
MKPFYKAKIGTGKLPGMQIQYIKIVILPFQWVLSVSDLIQILLRL